MKEKYFYFYSPKNLVTGMSEEGGGAGGAAASQMLADQKVLVPGPPDFWLCDMPELR